MKTQKKLNILEQQIDALEMALENMMLKMQHVEIDYMLTQTHLKMFYNSLKSQTLEPETKN